eukprot:TRINITY_DN1458_c0_g4_i2.p1 TRINITY_DN1458_c0_g4~~TRINITY_DN1458_c0_g4_i2.p1  ORF type:complete len:1827 (-),score=341.23 TRINITY_DN1458_c0_g4_i2:67-5547(-)
MLEIPRSNSTNLLSGEAQEIVSQIRLGQQDMKMIYNPKEPASTEAGRVGGKGANLCKLVLNGDPGKAFRIISPLAYRYFTNNHRVDEKRTLNDGIIDLTIHMNATDTKVRRAVQAQIEAWFMKIELDELLKDAIDTAYMEVTREDLAHRCTELINHIQNELASAASLPSKFATYSPPVSAVNQRRMSQSSSTPQRISFVSIKKSLETLYDLLNSSITLELWKSVIPDVVEQLKEIRQSLVLWEEIDVTRAIKYVDHMIEDVNGVTVAVRSTGTMEDTSFAPFPGQYETFLNIRGVEHVREAVKRDWAGNYTERVLSYRDQQALKQYAQHTRVFDLLTTIRSRIMSDSFSRQIYRFFQSQAENPFASSAALFSSLSFREWLESLSDWEHSTELLDLLKQYRHLFYHPDYAEMAVIIQKQAQGIDYERPAIERTACAYVFTADTSTGFTGRIFGTNKNFEPERRSRILYMNSSHGWGESLAQGDITADVDVYLAFDDDNGIRQFLPVRQLNGPKKVWTGSLEDAEEILREAEAWDMSDPENVHYVQQIHSALECARTSRRNTLSLPVDPAHILTFCLSESEKLNLARICDRSTDIYILRGFLKWLHPKKINSLADALFMDGIDQRVVQFFKDAANSPWTPIPSDINPLGVVWHWLYRQADSRAKATYAPFLTQVVKGMETCLPSEFGQKVPLIVQSTDYNFPTDLTDPLCFQDRRTVIDVGALKKKGCDIRLYPNGYLEGTSPDGRVIVPLIGSTSLSGIATRMAATGAIHCLPEDSDLLPEEHIRTNAGGEKVEFLITIKTRPTDITAMKKSLGVVAMYGTKTSHAAVESIGLDMASVVGIQKFMEDLKCEDPDRAEWVEEVLDTNGVLITVDGNQGMIYLAAPAKSLLQAKAAKLREEGSHERATRLQYLVDKYCALEPLELPVRQLHMRIDIERLPDLRRKVGWILTNYLDAWRSSKLNQSSFAYGLCVLRAEVSCHYVGINPRALIAYEVMTLLDGDTRRGLTPVEKAQLEKLRTWGIRSPSEFWPTLLEDVRVLRQHPAVIKRISRRIAAYIPNGWSRPSAISFFKRTHANVICSICASCPFWQKRTYRFLDFKLREMKALIGGNIFTDLLQEFSIVGFRGPPYLLSKVNGPTFLLELEVLGEIGKSGMQMDPVFSCVRYPEQLPECVEITLKILRSYGVSPRNMGVMIEVPANVLQIEQFADILRSFGTRYRFLPFFSLGTNDLTQGMFKFVRNSFWSPMYPDQLQPKPKGVQPGYRNASALSNTTQLVAINLGQQVSQATKKSPYIRRDGMGNYLLEVSDESRREIYLSIYHVAKVAKANKIELILSGEALNRLSVQHPEVAAKIAALVDVCYSSVPNFLNVVSVLSSTETLLGTISAEEHDSNAHKLISHGKSTILLGAAARTLVVVSLEDDIQHVSVGDFVLMTRRAVESLQELDFGEHIGALVLTTEPEYESSCKEFAHRLRKPCVLLGPDAFETLVCFDRQKVTIDFQSGRIYHGCVPIEERTLDENDMIAIRLGLAQVKDGMDVPTKRVVTHSAGRPILEHNVHPLCVIQILQDLQSGNETPVVETDAVLNAIRAAGMGRTRLQSTVLVTELLRDYGNVDEIVKTMYTELIYQKLKEAAVAHAPSGDMVVLVMDSSSTDVYATLDGAKAFETVQAEPFLGIQGLSRFVQPAYQTLYRAQLHAAYRIYNEGFRCGFVVVGANVLELSAEARRIYLEEVPARDLPFGLMVTTPSQLIDLLSHLELGKYDFVMIDDNVLPYSLLLADPEHSMIQHQIPQSVLDQMVIRAFHMVCSSVSEFNTKHDRKVEMGIQDRVSIV